MTNPGLAVDEPNAGSFVLAATQAKGARISHWTGWPKGRWWNGPLLFGTSFRSMARSRPDPNPHSNVGVVCIQRTLAAGESGSFEFLLGWHFPNRTPDSCGWTAPPGEGKTIIGNYYGTRFKDAWEAVSYTATHLEELERRTRQFTEIFRASSLPDSVKDAASANLSTLATTTCFRTADGEFHGFEGAGDTTGSCPGNWSACLELRDGDAVSLSLVCALVAQERLRLFAGRSGRAMHFRQTAAGWQGAAWPGCSGRADGANCACVARLEALWRPGLAARSFRAAMAVKKAIEFAWVPNGWDPNKDGVLEGVQHTTYDVEFYGPNPMCGIYYLAAITTPRGRGNGRSCAEIPLRRRNTNSFPIKAADGSTRTFSPGRYWRHLQQVRGVRADYMRRISAAILAREETENQLST